VEDTVSGRTDGQKDLSNLCMLRKHFAEAYKKFAHEIFSKDSSKIVFQRAVE
jgi:hypothetical protein